MIKFGTGGFRAVIGEEFTKNNVQLIAQALSNEAKKANSTKPVVIGYDYRFMSDYFAKYFAEVLAGNGIKALVFSEACPTPAVMTKSLLMDNDYGIMITASHNPYIYNGVKVFTSKGKDADVVFTKKLEEEILTINKINSISFDDGLKSGMISYVDGNEDYVNYIEKFVNIGNSSLKIAFDCMNGVTQKGIQYFSDKYNLNIKIVNGNRDAFFRNIPPAPTEKTLVDFKNMIVNEGFDIGFASDADGDRLGIIDSTGEFYSNNMIMALIYYYLVKYKGQKGDCVKNNSTSFVMDKLANKLGYKCIETPVGFKYISQAMIDYDALLGGESSGGLTVRGYIFGKDGTFSTMMLIEVLTQTHKTLKELVEEVKNFAEYDAVFVENSTRVKNKEHIIEVLKKSSPEFDKQIERINTEDGFKYFFTDGTWANIRFSGTEPLLRLFVETYTQSDADNMLNKIYEFINKNNI